MSPSPEGGSEKEEEGMKDWVIRVGDLLILLSACGIASAWFVRKMIFIGKTRRIGKALEKSFPKLPPNELEDEMEFRRKFWS